MIHRKDIFGHLATPMRVVHVPAGEQRPNHPATEIHPTEAHVEFYDTRYDHTPDGQFISDYYVSTFLEGSGDYGIDLYGGSDSWKINARTRKLVQEWLKQFAP